MRSRLCALLFGALLVAGLTACDQESSRPVAVPTTGEVGTGTPESAAAPTSQVSPIALRIPSIRVDSRDWQTVGIQPDGVIEIPPVEKPKRLGWYCPLWKDTDGVDCGAPVPGDTGPSVVLGHINSSGTPGVFARLSEVKVGQRIEIDRSDGYTAVFKVTTSKVVPKIKFPTKEIYGDTSTAQLRLISCGGQLDQRNRRYLGQVLVYAEMTDLRPTDLRTPGQ